MDAMSVGATKVDDVMQAGAALTAASHVVNEDLGGFSSIKLCPQGDGQCATGRHNSESPIAINPRGLPAPPLPCHHLPSRRPSH
jgi:hypothetical protein